MKLRFILIALYIISSPAWARPEFRIIPLQHRFAADLLPVLRPLAGEGGSVSGYGDQIIVNAEPADLANIEETIRRLDVALRNWRISVSHDAQSRQQSRSVGASGSIGNGSVRITVPDTKGHAPRGVAVTANESLRSSTQSDDMTLTVLDGTQAFISTGQQVPYGSYWIALTRRYARVVHSIDWVEVSTGFAVRPRQLGEMVDIEVVPRLAQPGGGGVIDFTELATHIRARPGEWVDLGGLLGNRDEVSRAIARGGEAQTSSTAALRIKVE